MTKLTKLLVLAIACCLLLTAPALAVGYEDVLPENSYWTEANMAYITGLPGTPVSLYKRAEEGSTSICGYFPGVIVEQISEAENGFVKVRIGSSTGYLGTNFIAAESACTPPLTNITSMEDVDLRGSIAANGKTIASLPNGTMIAVLGVRSDGWVQVIANGQVGFVKANTLFPMPVFGEGFTGVTENDKGETVTAAAADEAIICCSNINEMLSLRKRADIAAPAIGKYYNGTVVKLLEAPKNGWVKVQIAGQAEGYVQTSYLAMEGQSVTVGHRQMVIDNKSGTGLNMRSKPETNGKKIALYDNGTEVTVIGQWHNGWYHIVVDGQYGFVLDRLSEIK